VKQFEVKRELSRHSRIIVMSMPCQLAFPFQTIFINNNFKEKSLIYFKKINKKVLNCMNFYKL